MFIGEYRHNLDSKGRLAIPAKLRSQLKQGAVVTRGLDNCLFLYPKTAWKKIAEKLNKMPIGPANARNFSRFMLAGAMEVELDSQGRVTLPEYLREFADLKKKTVVAGVFDRLEIWEEEAWEKYKTSTEQESGKIAEAMGELGV
jgi:MraZ protein